MDSAIYRRLISSKNIYLALYSIESSSIDEYLLSNEEYIQYRLLKDKFNIKNINHWIDEIRLRIIDIMSFENLEDVYFNSKVYFNPKKANEFRPLHSASLIDQLSMICLLNVIIYEVDEKNGMRISGIGNLLPHDFYGNRVDINPESLFKPWVTQYKEYSDNATKLLSKYRETGEYKYEINLDLENFFPSINPVLLYNYLISLIPLYYESEDRICFKKIFEKLIFIKVANINNENEKSLYYEKAIDNSFTKGLPQGLPHTYFFANLIMVKIKEVYKEFFRKSEMLFYVDDSIIYTNDTSFLDIENPNKENSSFVTRLNKKINVMFSKYSNQNEEIISIYDKNKNFYEIKVHNFGKKSSFYKISEYKEGEINSSILGREISFFSTNQYKTLDEDSDNILLNKAEGLLNVIEVELNKLLLDKENKKDIYKSKLIRARKFFTNRKKYLNFKLDGEINSLVDNLNNELLFTLENIDGTKRDIESIKSNFCNAYKDTTLQTDIRYIISESFKYNLDVKSILSNLIKIDKILFGFENTMSSYIYKLIDIAKENKEILQSNINISKYKSLVYFIELKLRLTYGKHESVKIKKIEKELNYFLGISSKTCSNEDKDSFIDSYIINDSFVENNKFSTMSTLVNNNSDEIFRMIINAIISYCLQIEISDDFIINKSSDILLTYFELRILLFVRNIDFKLSKFREHYEDCKQKEYEKVIEYSIIQVLRIFQRYIQDSKNIDTLILTHKYTSDIWKNGSKQLYFYTLHNQEHAIELIKNSIKITKAIDLLQIKKMDYYILFLSCYLHDISMVTMPNYHIFQKNEWKSDIIFRNFQKEFIAANLQSRPISFLKQIMKETYLKIDKFYEDVIRDNHGRTSSKEILNRKALCFIDAPVRDIVSQVSISHAMKESDVYKSKSVALEHIVSLKYLKILLRISDVLDIGNNRVSSLLLSHNLDDMNEVSRFHWLSHSITNAYKINTEYSQNNHNTQNNCGENLFMEHSVIEKIIFTIPVNIFQYTECTKLECTNWYRSDIKENEIEIEFFNTVKSSSKGEILENNKDCKNCDNCIFICKWFVSKNIYLFKELSALQEYLQSIPNNMYLTQIVIRVKSEYPEILSPKQFSYLKDYVD